MNDAMDVVVPEMVEDDGSPSAGAHESVPSSANIETSAVEVTVQADPPT